ncbi:MAG: hypothetical protein KJ587_20205 [Alphaproteobacteria bacterium]|nr:hypothetical protein [Alphaproteobacteria bacterium]
MNEKEWASIWVTQDMCVWEGKIEIALIMVTAAAASCSVTLRKGRDSSASIFAVVKAAADNSKNVPIPRETFLENGLYVDIDTNTTGVLVVFRAISEITE